MSGSWVGAGGNMPMNKFNLLDDPHLRFQRPYSDNGLKYAALSYVSHQSSVVGSSASMDRRRDFGFVAQCQRNVLDKLFEAEVINILIKLFIYFNLFIQDKNQQRCLLKTLPVSYQAQEDPRFDELDESVRQCDKVNMVTCKCEDNEKLKPRYDPRTFPEMHLAHNIARTVRTDEKTNNSAKSVVSFLLTIVITALLLV